MGLDITQGHFEAEDYDAFHLKLKDNLAALGQLLKQQDFGVGSEKSVGLGAELEMYVVDAHGQPLNINQQLLALANDPQLTLELNKYNLEYNLTPYSIQENAFLATEKEIMVQLRKLNTCAKKHDGRVIPIGILPTLNECHFGSELITDKQRYHTLVEQLFNCRGSDFEIDINGKPPLKMDMKDVTLEGANTSFQVHYRVQPKDYANTFNAFQLVTPLVLALGANSPGIFGHTLWHETRVPLFKQSIDTRIKDRYQWQEPSRVSFGQGWVRESALELFQEAAYIYPPLLPINSDEDALADIANGKIPSLPELRMHQSSIWLWNRPVYDDADGGHLRIELRSLPAGPSAIDMAANAAFYIGLAESYKNEMPSLLPALPFNLAEHNFYRAAQSGIYADIVWPNTDQSGCKQQPILSVLGASVDRAREGLRSIGVSQGEIDRYLTVIQSRIDQKMTGAIWQSKRAEMYRQNYSNEESQRRMLEDYIVNSLQNLPVSQWPSE